MAPETYFVSISPLFFDPFKATIGVQSNQTYVQILGKFAHRSPSNFEILNQCHLWLLKVIHCPYGPGISAPVKDDQHERGAFMGMMPTHTQPAV